MPKYVDCEIVKDKLSRTLCLHEELPALIDSITAADVLPRDEAIKMGAELAAMHGSDATSQQLEEAYFKGVEDGMTRRDVRPVMRGKWIYYDSFAWKCTHCGWLNYHNMGVPNVFNFCPNCGAWMEES